MGHKKLLADTVKIKRQDLWQKIYQNRPVLALEIHLLARRNGVVLAGRPDSALFCKGILLIIFEHKFSESGATFKTHHVQAMVYSILLNSAGFETSRLFYAFVIADPKGRDDKQLKQNLNETGLKNDPIEATITVDNARIQHIQFK